MLANTEQRDKFIELFHHHGTKLSYKKGEFIIRPGDIPSGIFLIESGTVKAYDITKYGEENLLSVRKKGEIFPLIWTITGKGRQVIYEALVPTVVWRVKRELFVGAVQEEPDIIFPFMDIILEMYRIHSERIFGLEYRSIRERLISFLLIMSQRFGRRTGEGLLIDVPLRHQDIASSINSSRETASREITALERKNLLTNYQGYIILKDVKKLKEYL